MTQQQEQKQQRKENNSSSNDVLRLVTSHINHCIPPILCTPVISVDNLPGLWPALLRQRLEVPHQVSQLERFEKLQQPGHLPSRINTEFYT
jgi:hypothetical protein